uniref:Uncharacterized protein n=1 Tax=Zea mays TaxID=4577 RepID=C4J7T4_MAIZE|nr:unknown [Zea mays]ACR37353.1 unknown [Zea mays]
MYGVGGGGGGVRVVVRASTLHCLWRRSCACPVFWLSMR